MLGEKISAAHGEPYDVCMRIGIHLLEGLKGEIPEVGFIKKAIFTDGVVSFGTVFVFDSEMECTGI